MSHGSRPGPESAEPSRGPLSSPSESGATSTFRTTESSGLGSSSQGPSGTTTDSEAISAPETGRIGSLKNLEEITESYRGGKTSKTEAVASILRTIGENIDVSLTQSQRDEAFDSYLAEILSTPSTHDNSGRLDSSRVRPNEQGESSSSSSCRRSARKVRDTADSDSEGDDDKPSKKQRLLESEMPWFTEVSDPSTSYSNPSCEETCRLLRSYNRDISKAKFYIKIAPNSPTGIPSSQWERILKGEAVDLNQIFASLHHVVPDEERTGRLGDTEISFGVAEPRKRISSAAEWSTAWRRASKAIGFAFPHRKEELLEYGDYIESEFAAKISSSHHKLLLYDVALRNEVAAGQHALLTDHQRFSRLYSAIVMPDGIEGNSEKTPGKKPSKSRQGGDKPEICNKFNAGTCKNSDAECKYRHLCKNCRKPGHGDKDCSKEGK